MDTWEILILFIATIFTSIWIMGIRSYGNLGLRVSQGVVNVTFLFVLSIIVALILNVSPLHLIWMFLLSVIIGLMYLSFPFSLISVPATLFEKLCYIGFNYEKINKLNSEIKEVIGLMTKEKLTQEEAIDRVKSKRVEE
jgi:hypothetical protein